MALPAGYSSEEDFSDDGLTIFSEIKQKERHKPYNRLVEEEPVGEKLISAVIDEDVEEVKKLVKGGADLEYRSKYYGNWTALMVASSRASPQVVKALVELGASTSQHTELVTPLLCLCNSTCQDEVRVLETLNHLLEYDADLKVKDWYRMTPLIYAVKRNNEKLVLRLLLLGCNIEEEDTDGWTPIFYAVDGGFINLVQILKDAGASIKRVDNRGRSLYDIAIAKYYKNIAEMVNTVEKAIEVDDVIERFKDYKRMSNYECVLLELPDKSKGRFHGFPTEAARWVHGVGLTTLVKLFLERNIQLGQVLTMSDDELRDMGVIFSYDRTKIRYCIKMFHQHSWGKNCVKIFKENEVIDLHAAAQAVCNAIRQVHIISTATYFWKKHNDQELNQTKKLCINKCLYFIKHLRNEIDIISKIVRDIDEGDPISPSDLILPQKTKIFPCLNKKMILITTIFFVILCKTGRPLLNNSLTSFRSCFSFCRLAL